ncbi:MAG: OB-fold nucleic acid binding domain-containing protein, partial [Acidimicrobiales bacterium]
GAEREAGDGARGGALEDGRPAVPGSTPISEVRYRSRARVVGQVHSIEVQPQGGTQILTAQLDDGTGGITLVWSRRRVDGIEPSARLVAEGMVGEYGGHLAIRNPDVELLAPPSSDPVQ